MTTESPIIRVLTRELDPAVLGGLPFWRYAALFGPRNHCFLLDSALADGDLGRHSYLGGTPAAVLTARPIVQASEPGPTRRRARLSLSRWKSAAGNEPGTVEEHEWLGDPFKALRDLMNEYWPGRGDDRRDDSASPLQGGLVGYFGYEAGHYLERLPDTGHDNLQLPDLAFLVVDEILAWDHRSGSLSVSVTGRGPDAESAWADAAARADQWPRRLREYAVAEAVAGPAPAKAANDRTPAVDTDFERGAYCAAVQKCRDHILVGDVFEVCLTNRMETEQAGSPWDLYRSLRRLNPAPFASYLQFPDFQIVGSSPERFLRLDGNRIAESRPIKGTRPRGETAARDDALRRELSLSPKDRAENLMIVDLVRSDLGRVAEIGSVTVPEMLVVEEYATVFQLTSTIRARLRDDCDALDLVRACFPGGSMTGAPKIEAMKIIDSIEPTRRGIYSGAIGYLDYSGAMDLSIVIRSIVCKDGRGTFGTGGAVIADSDPAAEYQEMLDKARALIEALGSLTAGDSGDGRRA